MSKVGNIISKVIDWVSNIFSVSDLKDKTPQPKKKTEQPKPSPKIEPKPTTPIDIKPKPTTPSDIKPKPTTNTSGTETSGAITIDPDYSNRQGYELRF